MEGLCDSDIIDVQLPRKANQITDCAEKNDFESADKILSELKKYFELVKIFELEVKNLFFPAYELAFHLNHKEFCYKLMHKVTEVTGFYDFEETFFDQSCKFFFDFIFF